LTCSASVGLKDGYGFMERINMNECSSLNVRDQVSHLYRTTRKIIVLYSYILMFMFWRADKKSMNCRKHKYIHAAENCANRSHKKIGIKVFSTCNRTTYYNLNFNCRFYFRLWQSVQYDSFSIVFMMAMYSPNMLWTKN
jgi:hypothetical protein